MQTPESTPAGAPCWIDLTTSAPGRARSFYALLFGWNAEEPTPESGGYFNFSKDDIPVAGCMASQPGSTRPGSWSVYLASDDATRTLDATVAQGGQVIVPATNVADLGTMAVVADPGGAGIGIWQSAGFHGFEVRGQPGTPTWFELHTRDYEIAVAFYREVFRWDSHVISDTPEFRLTTISDGESQLAGIMDATGYLPEGVPPYWEVYFAVENADRALATITGLGGSILKHAQDTPHGRLAAATDPTGASFKLVGGA
jgi:predicted enzyme related to lactoylglutathione lyase